MVKSTMTETCSAVLRSRQNCSSDDGAERTDDGRAFHARAAVTGKARPPRVVRRVVGMTSVVGEALRRWTRPTTCHFIWEYQSSLHCITVSTDVMSDHIGRRDASPGGGCSKTSPYTGQCGWTSMVWSLLSVADLWRSEGGATMLHNTVNHQFLHWLTKVPLHATVTRGTTIHRQAEKRNQFSFGCISFNTWQKTGEFFS